ncbi:MAG: carboxypeptidase-like regulatory domain-containing protein, partial [Acidobacteriota bacterium]
RIAFELPGSAAILGRVVDRGGEPVAGATVFVLEVLGPMPDRARQALSVRQVTSERDGRFRLPAPLDVALTLGAEAPGHGPGILEVQPDRQDPAVTLTLGPPRSVGGRLVDADGEPVSGAVVHFSPNKRSAPGWHHPSRRHRTQTGDDGRFRFDGLSVDRYRLEGRAEGHPPISMQTVEITEDDRDLDLGDIRLPAGADLRGRVTGGDAPAANAPAANAPAANAFIRAVTSSGTGFGQISHSATARSDDDGRFILKGLLPERRYTLEAELDGWRGVPTVATAEDGPVELLLKRAAVLEGRILDPDGQPISEAVVILKRNRIGSQASVDADGRYRHETAAGVYRLEVEAAGFRQWSRSEVRLEPGATAIDVRLERGFSVSGRVFDADGTPMVGAQLWAMMGGGSTVSGNTDDDGRFRVDGLAAGPLRIQVEHQRWGAVFEELTLAESRSDVEIRFPEGGRLAGQVIDADEGTPISGATISASLPLNSRRTATTDGDGRFLVDNAAPGRYRVTASRDGYARRVVEEVEVPEPGAAAMSDLVIELDRGATLTGRVVGVDPQKLTSMRLGGDSGDFRFGAPDADGRYRFGHLARGEWTLQAQATDGRNARIRFTVDRSTRDLERDLEFTGEGIVITGEVVRGSHAVGGAKVAAIAV